MNTRNQWSAATRQVRGLYMQTFFTFWIGFVQRWKLGIFSLCSVKLNVASINGPQNIQQVLQLSPSLMKYLCCYIVDSSINYFLWVCQIMYWCPVDLVLNKSPQEKNQVVLGLVIWQAMWYTVILFRSILQGIVHLRKCGQCWKSVVEPHPAG